jgi:hypothetical protein
MVRKRRIAKRVAVMCGVLALSATATAPAQEPAPDEG